jgi:GxxExxY protein
LNHQDTKGTKKSVLEFEKVEEGIDRIATQVVDAAYKIHRKFGPGLLESAYEACLIHELRKRRLKIESQVAVPLDYEGERVDVGFRIDLLVEGRLIVELKAVEAILPVHKAQVITYLKIKKERLGLLINFNVPLIKKGIQRIVL